MPPGTYWLDLFGDDRTKFAEWRKAHAAAVRVVTSESFDTSPPRDWVKFVVSSPVPWDAKEFGFPTIIPAGSKVESSADTVQRPDPEKDPLDQLGDALSFGGIPGQFVTGAVVLGGLLVFANILTARRGR